MTFPPWGYKASLECALSAQQLAARPGILHQSLPECVEH
jgi:hypothetical protein